MKTASIDLACHYGGKAKEACLRPWYLRMPLIYNRYTYDDITKPETTVRSGLHFGYAWFCTPRIGIQPEAGLGYVLYNEHKERMLGSSGVGFEPLLNVTMFIRL